MLRPALKDVARAIMPKSPHYALAGVRFVADKEQLFLTGSDLDFTINRIVPADIIQSGGIILPLTIVKLVDRLPSGTISINATDTVATIEYADSIAAINGCNANEYPELPNTEKEATFEIAGETLYDAVSRVIHMAADEHSSPVLAGVLFDINETMLTVAATNAHQLGYATVGLPKDLGTIKTIIPKKPLIEIMNLFKTSERINITIAENVVSFETEGLSIATRVVGGKYPDYQRVVPTDCKTRFMINNSRFREAVERASLINTGDTPAVTLEYVGNKLVVFQNSDTGKLREEYDTEGEGEDFQQCFNAKYLINILRSIPSEQVQITHTGNLAPLVLTPQDEKSLALVLPIRVPTSENVA